MNRYWVITKPSIALGRIIYRGGAHWASFSPSTPFRKYGFKCEAEAMARGLGDGARVELATDALKYQPVTLSRA